MNKTLIKSANLKKPRKVNYVIIQEVNEDWSLNPQKPLMQLRISDGKMKPYKSKQKYK